MSHIYFTNKQNLEVFNSFESLSVKQIIAKINTGTKKEKDINRIFNAAKNSYGGEEQAKIFIEAYNIFNENLKTLFTN
jgi:hypothetical protein